jgi:hypothetical protein
MTLTLRRVITRIRRTGNPSLPMFFMERSWHAGLQIMESPSSFYIQVCDLGVILFIRSNILLFISGIISTELFRHFAETWWAKIAGPVAKCFLKTPLQGAQTTIYCCLEESIQNHSGRYYSDCKEKMAASTTMSEEDAKRLWELSEKLVGLTPV